MQIRTIENPIDGSVELSNGFLRTKFYTYDIKLAKDSGALVEMLQKRMKEEIIEKMEREFFVVDGLRAPTISIHKAVDLPNAHFANDNDVIEKFLEFETIEHKAVGRLFDGGLVFKKNEYNKPLEPKARRFKPRIFNTTPDAGLNFNLLHCDLGKERDYQVNDVIFRNCMAFNNERTEFRPVLGADHIRFVEDTPQSRRPMLVTEGPEAKARVLLHRLVGDKKFRGYLKNGFISYTSTKTKNTYQIYPDHKFTKVWNKGKPIEELCAVFEDYKIPPTDSVVMRLLMLENDEAGFRDVAIKHTFIRD